MKYLWISVLALCCSVGYSGKGGKKKTEPLRWQETVVKADGIFRGTEWPTDFKYWDKNKMLYSISNDSKNLYIALKFPDVVSQVEILRNGLFVWVNDKNKRKGKRGINFPTALTPQQISELSYNPNSGSFLRKIIRTKNEFQLYGMVEGGPVYADNLNTLGLRIRCDYDSLDIMTYEAVIPLSQITDDLKALLTDKDRILSVTIQSTPPVTYDDDPNADTGVDMSQQDVSRGRAPSGPIGPNGQNALSSPNQQGGLFDPLGNVASAQDQPTTIAESKNKVDFTLAFTLAQKP